MQNRRTLLAIASLTALVVTTAAMGSEDEPEWGTRPQIPDSEEFLEAARSGDIKSIERLLKSRPELIDCGDEQGRSVLVAAFLSGQDLAGQALVHYGFQPDVVEAAMIPDWVKFHAMLDADPSAINRYHVVGGTALYAAARMGRKQLWRLQGRGADANANPRGADGVTAAFGAVECLDPLAAYISAVSLFSNGADVNAPQRNGWSVLHAAVDRDHPELVRYLIRRGARVDARDARGETPLDVARRREFKEMVALLENHGSIHRDHMVSRTARNAKGEPLVLPDLSGVGPRARERICIAARQSIMKLGSQLKKEPRLAFTQSMRGNFAVEVGAREGRHDVVHALLGAGAPQSFGTTLMIRDLERAREMLKEDPLLIHERGVDDMPMMWFSSIGGESVEVAELLLESGADVDQATLGTTALHWAAREGQIELVRFLLDHGADLDRVGYQFSRRGKTPLELARSRKQWQMVDFLEGL